MNKTYKNSLYVALSTLVCLFLAMPASAQRPSSGGGGSSIPRPSGGGGGGGSSNPSPSPSPRPSGGTSFNPRPSGGSSMPRPQGSVGVARPSGSVGVARPGYGQQRTGVAPQQGYISRPGSNNNGYIPRVGVNQNRGGSYVPRQGAVRGNYGYAPRVGVTARGNASGSVSSYRSSPQVGYGHGGGYWGNHGYYHYNRGYYNSYYRPRLGFSIGFLPYGYYPFYFGDYQYFYSDGLFYQYDNNQYTVVEPPVGAEVSKLPANAQSIVINGQQYYELNGVYYQPVTKDDGTLVYQIAGKDGELNTNTIQDDEPQGPQMGDIVLQLPPDCRKIRVNGEKLYVSPDGVYYQEQKDSNGNRAYKIVGLPSDEPEQN